MKLVGDQHTGQIRGAYGREDDGIVLGCDAM
jgi:hypothetical protein